MPTDDAGQSGDNGDANQKGDGDTITLTQSELDAKMAEVRRGVEKSISEKFADYDELKKKAQQYDELEESKKTQEQKLLDRIEKLEKSDAEKDKALKESEINRLRERVAGKFKLSESQAARLQGDSIEELEADAKEVFGEPNDDDDDTEERKPGVVRQPKTTLKGGSNSSTDDTADEVKKVFDSIDPT